MVFVGKLIASKGVELLLAAWPLVLARVPDARLVVVGFGAFRAGLEQLAADLARGDLAAARATRGEHGEPLELLQAFLDGLDDEGAQAYAEAAAALPARVTWVGRLEHDELADLLPAAEAMVVPSTFPEAFGMVAAEAAACGALPVVARHSGLAEVAETLAGAVPEAARPLLGFTLGPQAVPELAAALTGWLEAPEALRARRARGDGGHHARALLVGGRGEVGAGRGAGAPGRSALPLNRYDSATHGESEIRRRRRCRPARGAVGLRAQG